MSLYHWGLQVLPSPAFSYPLWPIVLGITGGFLDLTRAAALLPECLYLVSLVLLFFLSRRVATMVEGLGPTGSIPIPRFETAVVVLLLLGLNPVFFVFTSLPYTEALGLAIAFLSLLLVPPAEEGVAVRGVLATFLACLAFLVRPQLFVVCVGVLPGSRLALRPTAGFEACCCSALESWGSFWAPGRSTCRECFLTSRWLRCSITQPFMRIRRFFTTSGSFRTRPSLIVLWMQDVG